MKKNISGFTIVELLIVIVVIAILAAISVVAYTGVQNRAYNSKVISGTSQYQKAFLSYRAVNGSYPASGGCLGANYPSNNCWAGSADGATPPIHNAVNATLDSNLSEFIPNKPEISRELIYIAFIPQYRGGLAYMPGDGTYGYRLVYYLKGNNANCGLVVAGQANEGTLTQCNISLPN